ncbi:MAG: S8 family serine peptidase, partial [Anaerolineales bacterium]|nr:S8 family serine peptidase [Anaerolineales bacterium]
GFHQRWSPAPTRTLTGTVQIGDGAGGNLDGCLPFAAGSLAGRAVLVDRGTCAVSEKGANASAAGAALVLVADNEFGNTPPALAFGGGTQTAPVLTITQADGLAAKAEIGQAATLDHTSFICIADDIIANSSRGPRIADNGIKPDLAAPGGSRSAEAGSGAGQTEFGGTSGAAPLTAGTAALLIQSLKDRGLWAAPDPGLGATGISVAPLVKALLMNTAQPNTTIGGRLLAPITLQGAGRLDALAAARSGTLALDVTDLYNWAATRSELPCALTSSPTNGVALAAPPSYYNGSYGCLSAYPFANEFFNAWNALTGSLSFGYDGVAASTTVTRKVMIQNLTGSARTYRLSSAFRYADDDSGAVTLAASPAEVTVPGRGYSVVDVTLKVSAKGLRHWTLDAGQFGDHGTRLECAGANPAVDCPTLTIFEYDGFLTIDGGAQNTVRLPWQVLPKKAAQVEVERVDATSVKLRNAAGYETGLADVFALLDVSPNKCEILGGGGTCVEANYQPGVLPAINGTFVDLNEIGLRSYAVPGLNAAFGLPAAPAGALADEVVEFAVTVYDKPYRASHNFPVEFDVAVDADRNGLWDYVVFNADRTLTGADGRNAVFVRDVNPADGTRPTRAYFYSVTDFNSQNWIMPVPAAAIDTRSDQPFSFRVQAFDAYFTSSTGPIQDCSPGDCRSGHMVQTGLLKYQPAAPAVQVPPLGFATLLFGRPAGGESASPSQIGLVFLYRSAPVGAESQNVVLP